METIADIVSPPLLAACAALGLGIGAALFFMYRRGAHTTLVLGAPLSWTEPIEVRLVLYMLFAAACATAALLSRFLFMLPGDGTALAGLLLLVTVLWAVLMVGFFYATAGTLLQAALGVRGRPEYWFVRWLSPLDRAIMSVGDTAGRFILRPAPSQRRSVPVHDEPARAEERAFEADDDAELEQKETGRRRPEGRKRRTPEEIARERLDAALISYEASLRPDQLEKLHYIRAVTEWLKQSA